MLRKEGPFEDLDLDSLVQEIGGEEGAKKKGPVRNKGSGVGRDADGLEMEIFRRTTTKVSFRKRIVEWIRECIVEWILETFYRIIRR